jgi:hypothetical protein
MHKEHFFRLKNQEKKDLKTIYLDALKQSPLIQNILDHPTATLVSCVQSATDYSYVFVGAGI